MDNQSDEPFYLIENPKLRVFTKYVCIGTFIFVLIADINIPFKVVALFLISFMGFAFLGKFYPSSDSH
jgi:hypothetical protein